ncbi:MAG TPA: hypothetical protein VMY43_08785, partial [Methanothrix sp.]|nr:hypothetical protein [Methanothrix sp.]
MYLNAEGLAQEDEKKQALRCFRWLTSNKALFPPPSIPIPSTYSLSSFLDLPFQFLDQIHIFI